MPLSVTLLMLAFLLDGLLEGIRWTDTEDVWLDPPDFFHLAIGVRNGAFVGAALLGVAFFDCAGAVLVGFAFRELALDTVVLKVRGRPWKYLARLTKQPLYGIPRFPLLERLTALILGGWLLGL